jgi:cytidylate kinase
MPIVTISRGSMSGGRALAQSVCRELRSTCVGREVLVEAAAKLGVPEKELVEKVQRPPGLWGRFKQERRIYLVAVQAALAEYVATGNIVYHGLAGHMLLRGLPAVLRVRLIAPVEMRIKAVIEEQGINAADAERYIKHVDEQRSQWTKFMYGVQILDPQLYDLVVNLEAVSLPTAAEIVVATVKRPEFMITQEVAGLLEDFALASRIKLALAADLATRGLELEVRAARGAVTIRGTLPRPATLLPDSGRCEADVRQAVSTVPGVKMLTMEFDHEQTYY